jgi:hypothetical protein
MLPSLVKRQLHQQGWEKPTYEDLLQSPLGRLVSCTIELAAQNKAAKITFGMPPGMELSKEDKVAILSRYAECENNTKAAMENLREESDNESAIWKREGLVRFHRRDDLPEVPLWHEIDGQWIRYPGVMAWFYPYVPQHLCERLVSLDIKPMEGGREEWIEYGSNTLFGDNDNDRRFVRVDLVVEANNSFTIELLQYRVEDRNAKVCWRYWEV